MAAITDPGDVRDDTQTSGGTSARPLDADESAKFDQLAASYHNPNDVAKDPTQSGGTKPPAKSEPKQAGSGTSPTIGGAKSGAGNLPGGAAGGIGGRMGGIMRSKRNNKPLSYALLAVVIAGLLSGGFFSILPLKLESMIKNIIEKRIEGRMKHYMESRLINKNLLKDYFKDSLDANNAEFEEAIAGYDDATKDLLRTWRNAKIEDALNNEDSIKVVKTGDTVEVFKDGESLGTIDSVEGLDEAMSGVEDVSEGINMMYRNPLRSMAKILYDKAKWTVYNNEQDPEKAQVEVTSEVVSDASVQVADGATAVVDCVVSQGDCPTDESNQNPAERITQDTADTAPSHDGNGGDSQVESSVQTGVSQAESQTHSFLSKLSYLNYANPNYYLGKIVSKILLKYLAVDLSQIFSKVFAAAAGPLIAIEAIDIASRIDHFFWYGGADKILVNIHKIQYAAEFFEYSTMADQQKAGQNVSGAEVNATNLMLNGSENSAASRSIYGTGTGGQSLYQLDNGTTDQSSRSIDEQHFPIEDEYKNVILPSIAGDIGGIPIGVIPIPGFHFVASLQADLLHYLLLGWYDTLGKVWGAIEKLIGLPATLILDGLKQIPGVSQGIDWLTEHAGKILGDLVIKLIRPAVDGTEIGADLYNGLDAGGAVVGMDFARTLGGHLLTPLQSATVNQEVSLEQQQDASKLSLATRLFSTNYAQSGVNLLALQMPSTPNGALSDGVNYVASIITKPYAALIPAFSSLGIGSAQADNLYDSQYGLNDWGFTDQDLQADDSTQINAAFASAAQRLGIPVSQVTLDDVTLEDCPTPADVDHTANVCRLDIATMRSMGTAFTNTDGGINSAW